MKLLTVWAVTMCYFALPQQTHGANILGIFTSASPSHLLVHMAVVEALAEQGHNVTVVTALKPKTIRPNMHIIYIPPPPTEEKQMGNAMSGLLAKKTNIFKDMIQNFQLMFQLIAKQEHFFVDERMISLYESNQFDLMILGYFLNDFSLAVAAQFKCPVIINYALAANALVTDYVGNPSASAYVPNLYIPAKRGQIMSLWLRIQNQMLDLLFAIMKKQTDQQNRAIYSKLIPVGSGLPSYDDMLRNVSLVFTNEHFSEGVIRPKVPALIEIGGIQIKEKVDPLPNDIAEFMNAAEQHGAILFSLGSNIKSSLMSPHLIAIIYETFASLEQKVIWKWDDLQHTPGNATNVLFKSWLPQNDILAHRNLKLFITHAGKGGIAEAQYFAVPMIALPVTADQPTNAMNMVASGFGLQLDFNSLNVQDFKAAIQTVLQNSTFSQNIKSFSQKYRDRPLSAKESVVYWTEYVLRNHGARHMQSPLVHMNFVQGFNLDVIFVFLAILYILYLLFKVIVLFIWKLLKRHNVKGTKKHKIK